MGEAEWVRRVSGEIGLAIDHAACDPGAWDGVMAEIGRQLPGSGRCSRSSTPPPGPPAARPLGLGSRRRPILRVALRHREPVDPGDPDHARDGGDAFRGADAGLFPAPHRVLRRLAVAPRRHDGLERDQAHRCRGPPGGAEPAARSRAGGPRPCPARRGHGADRAADAPRDRDEPGLLPARRRPRAGRDAARARRRPGLRGDPRPAPRRGEPGRPRAAGRGRDGAARRPRPARDPSSPPRRGHGARGGAGLRRVAPAAGRRCRRAWRRRAGR